MLTNFHFFAYSKTKQNPNFKAYFTNYNRSNTRHVCTHFNAFIMKITNTAMKLIFLNNFAKFGRRGRMESGNTAMTLNLNTRYFANHNLMAKPPGQTARTVY